MQARQVAEIFQNISYILKIKYRTSYIVKTWNEHHRNKTVFTVWYGGLGTKYLEQLFHHHHFSSLRPLLGRNDYKKGVFLKIRIPTLKTRICMRILQHLGILVTRNLESII